MVLGIGVVFYFILRTRVFSLRTIFFSIRTSVFSYRTSGLAKYNYFRARTRVFS